MEGSRKMGKVLVLLMLGIKIRLSSREMIGLQAPLTSNRGWHCD